MYTLRQYTDKDYDMVAKWWKRHGNKDIPKESFPLDTTFIMDINDMPAYCVSLVLTNTKNFCMLENVCGNPDIEKEKRGEAFSKIIESAFSFAKTLGYQKVVGFSVSDKLTKKYEDLGCKQIVLANLMVKEL